MKAYLRFIQSITLLAVFSLSAKLSAATHWHDPQYIIDSFFEVSLGNEYGQNSGLNLRKWQQPIRIYVEHQVGDRALNDELLDAQIDHLVSITGFDIQRVNDKSQANLFYFFTRQSALPTLVKRYIGQAAVTHLHGSVCLANIYTGDDDSIDKAHIFVAIDQARMHGKLVACIVEEITQTLGLIRDSDLVFPSIFNDKSQDMLLSGLDEILLRLLSEEEVKAGMSAKQLEPILHKLLKQYQQAGLIISADKRVRRGKLYEMLGYRPAR